MVDALPDELAGDYEPDDYDGDEALGGWSDQQAEHISSTNSDRVRSLFEQAGKDALIATLLNSLSDTYDAWSADDGSRAADIAGDAVTAGWHYGEMDTAIGLQSSVTTLEVERTWNALNDARTRQTHADADGQTAAPGETFTVGADQLNFPCDPDGSPEEVCNCRCFLTWTFTWNGENARQNIYANSNDAATLGYE